MSKGETWGSHGFWNPLIPWGRIKLENSNLAHIWMAVSTNEKNAKLGQKGVIWVSRDPLLEFWDPIITPER